MTGKAEWEGRVGTAWAEEWQRTERMFSELAPHLDAAIDAAAPPCGGAVLDVGCGAGSTSLGLAACRPDLAITGVDVSSALLAAARRRAGSQTGLRFLDGDAATMTGIGPFDLVMSRHGVMFFDDPVAAFRQLHALARPGGRLVFSCFRTLADNPWAADLVTLLTGKAPQPPAGYAPGPFGFADGDFTAALLRDSGWRSAAAARHDYAVVAGTGGDAVAEAIQLFSRIGPAAPLLAAAGPEERAAMVARLSEALAQRMTAGEVRLPASAWIWTASA
jgi:SAM-dependent methyltransferase